VWIQIAGGTRKCQPLRTAIPTILLLPLGGDFAAGERQKLSFGTRFVLYHRNIENLCKDKATLCDEIRKSVAELYDAAHDLRAPIAIKGAPEQHAEIANVSGDEDG
jgi:hypothetical protein